MEENKLLEDENIIRAETFMEGESIEEAAKEIRELEKNMDPVIRIGDKAPNFTSDTTFGPMKLTDFKGKWLILFSHPGDFTPVCTTEIIAFSKMYPEFMKRDCNLLGLSIDSNPSHLDWTYDIYKNTGIQIPFPIIADRNMNIAKKYNMLAPKASKTDTIRCVYFIDPNQIIRAILTYPLTNGRNVGEILRLLDALQITDKEQVMTSANWFPNQPVIVPSPKNYKDVIERMKNSMDYTCYDWFLCYKQNQMQPMINNNFNFESKDKVMYNEPLPNLCNIPMSPMCDNMIN